MTQVVYVRRGEARSCAVALGRVASGEAFVALVLGGRLNKQRPPPSKGTPIPVPRHRVRHLGRVQRHRAMAVPQQRIRRRRRSKRGGGRVDLARGGTAGAAAARGRVAAAGLARGEAAPLLELGVAVAAGAAGDAARVEVGVLVEGDLEGGVLVAEDVAALAAVVAAREVVEVALAGRVIAHCGLLVGLREGEEGRC